MAKLMFGRLSLFFFYGRWYGVQDFSFSSFHTWVQRPVDSRRAGMEISALCLALGTQQRTSIGLWAVCIDTRSSSICGFINSTDANVLSTLINRSTTRLTWSRSLAPSTGTLPGSPCHGARNQVLLKVKFFHQCFQDPAEEQLTDECLCWCDYLTEGPHYY